MMWSSVARLGARTLISRFFSRMLITETSIVRSSRDLPSRMLLSMSMAACST